MLVVFPCRPRSDDRDKNRSSSCNYMMVSMVTRSSEVLLALHRPLFSFIFFFSQWWHASSLLCPFLIICFENVARYREQENLNFRYKIHLFGLFVEMKFEFRI